MTKIRKPISSLERLLIELWVRYDLSYREMARRLKRNHTVIMREIKRNSGQYLPYTANTAEKIRLRRKQQTRQRKIDCNLSLQEYIIKKMTKSYWSPQDIAGRLKQVKSANFSISHESIYQWIYYGEGKYLGLYRYLHYKRFKRRQRHVRKQRFNPIITNRTSIHDRPGIVEQRQRLGDWESDTMVFSKQKSCLSVQYERKSRLVRMTKMINRSANETLNALTASIESLSQGLFKTITFDNGLEAANHIDIANDYNLDTFFCDPYASWQKGGVENMNKWIRRFLPSRTDMEQVTDEHIYTIQEILNNKPRKSLGFKTPNEIIQQHLQSGALLT